MSLWSFLLKSLPAGNFSASKLSTSITPNIPINHFLLGIHLAGHSPPSPLPVLPYSLQLPCLFLPGKLLLWHIWVAFLTPYRGISSLLTALPVSAHSTLFYTLPGLFPGTFPSFLCCHCCPVSFLSSVFATCTVTLR